MIGNKILIIFNLQVYFSMINSGLIFLNCKITETLFAKFYIAHLKKKKKILLISNYVQNLF